MATTNITLPAGGTSTITFNTKDKYNTEDMVFEINAAESSSSSIYEESLLWGNTNKSDDGGRNGIGGFGCVDAARVGSLGANRTAFIPSKNVTVEYSTDGKNYNTLSVSENQKIGFFTDFKGDFSLTPSSGETSWDYVWQTIDSSTPYDGTYAVATIGGLTNDSSYGWTTVPNYPSYYIITTLAQRNAVANVLNGKPFETRQKSTSISSSDFYIRVTLSSVTPTSNTNVLYTRLHKFVIKLDNGGASESYCDIDGLLQSKISSSNADWKNFASKVTLKGVPGYNVINTSEDIPMFGENENTEFGKIRFTFTLKSVNRTLHIYGVNCYGGNGYITPSTMASTGNIFDFSMDQSVNFPMKVSADTFYGNFDGTLHGTADYANGVPWSGITGIPNFAGSTISGGSADSAQALYNGNDVYNVGDSSTPVYFSDGVPVACDSIDSSQEFSTDTSNELSDSVLTLNYSNKGKRTYSVYNTSNAITEIVFNFGDDYDINTEHFLFLFNSYKNAISLKSITVKGFSTYIQNNILSTSIGNGNGVEIKVVLHETTAIVSMNSYYTTS